MRVRDYDVQQAQLIHFFTKKGDTTISPYEAQIWKERSIPIYAQIIDDKKNTVQVHVKKIRFKNKQSVKIDVSVKKEAYSYELTNTKCDTRILHYDELYFFDNNNLTIQSSKRAFDKVFSSPDDIDCQEQIQKKIEAGKTVSVLYIDGSNRIYSMYGIIPFVESYDSEKHIITTRFEKIFIVQKK